MLSSGEAEGEEAKRAADEKEILMMDPTNLSAEDLVELAQKLHSRNAMAYRGVRGNDLELWLMGSLDISDAAAGKVISQMVAGHLLEEVVSTGRNTMGKKIVLSGEGTIYRVVLENAYAENDEEYKVFKAFLKESTTNEMTKIALLLRSNLEIKDRSWRMMMFRSCFEGTEAVAELLRQQLAGSVRQAVLLGQTMESAGLLSHVTGDHRFDFEPFYYRFYFDGARANSNASKRLRWNSNKYGLRFVLKFLTIWSGLAFVCKTWYDAALVDWKFCQPGAPWVCATTIPQLACFTVSRFSAGCMYACFIIIFGCKFPATRRLVQESQLGSWIDFEPVHEIHTYYGTLITLDAFMHTTFHFIRLGLRGQFDNGELTAYRTLNSGYVTLLFMVICMLPMTPIWKRNIGGAYEIRKFIHYFFLPTMFAFAFHHKRCAFIGGILVIWYLLDTWIWGFLFETYYIEAPSFKAVGKGVSITFKLPRDYKFVAGQYIFINIPWIAALQWHAFSVMPSARLTSEDGESHTTVDTDEGKLYIAVAGDFTADLFLKSLEQTQRPMFITRPMPSALHTSIQRDKICLVGSGVGITPLISIINRYQGGSKNVSLLWMCRDMYLIELMMPLLIDVNAEVYYTGKFPKDFAELNNHLEEAGTRSSHHPLSYTVSQAGSKRSLHRENTVRELTERSGHLSSAGHATAATTDMRSTRMMKQVSTKYDQLQMVTKQWKGKGKKPTMKLKSGRPDLGQNLEDLCRRGNEKKTRGAVKTGREDHNVHSEYRAILTAGMDQKLTPEEERLQKMPGRGWACVYCGASAAVAANLAKVCMYWMNSTTNKRLESIAYVSIMITTALCFRLSAHMTHPI
ncbi:unnamed protein product [Chrysoparadoxa australica]